MMQNSRGVVLSGTKTYFEGLKRVCISYECFQQYLWHGAQCAHTDITAHICLVDIFMSLLGRLCRWASPDNLLKPNVR